MNDLTGKSPGGPRTPLKDVLPLDTPFIIQVFPTYACNFKCFYCLFSVPKKDRHFISDRVNLPLDTYKKAVDSMAHFPNKIKVVRFVGIGEPLLHPDIVEMVDYTKKANVANTVEILTNGSLLTPELSDKLIETGFERLVVSLQGVSQEQYRETSQVSIDFDKFLENLTYFYKNKTNAHVYFKIVDTALKSEADKQLFFDIFGDICDSIAIEYTVPIHTGMHPLDERSTTQFGGSLDDDFICSQSFMHMQINSDAKVTVCYSFEYPIIVGDASKDSLVDIWNGDTLKAFRLNLLSGNTPEVCRRCTISKYRLWPEDKITSLDSKRLQELYNV